MKAKIIKLHGWTESDRIEIYDALQGGQVIAYPTDTIYGLGVDVFNSRAVAALLRMKGRDSRKPVSILYAGVERLLKDFAHLNDFQKSAAKALLPGSVTLILPVKFDEWLPAPFVRDGYTGVRVVDLPALNALLAGYPHPISTTSINPAAAKPAASVTEIHNYFPDEISHIIDNGSRENSRASTIIKLYPDSWEIIRGQLGDYSRRRCTG